jgi:hypothetical protein
MHSVPWCGPQDENRRFYPTSWPGYSNPGRCRYRHNKGGHTECNLSFETAMPVLSQSERLPHRTLSEINVSRVRYLLGSAQISSRREVANYERPTTAASTRY